MSKRYPGGFLTGDEPTVNQTEADGIWTLDQQAAYQGQGVWPPSQYQISRSLRFNSADTAYLSRTPASAGNRKTWTWSGWVKRSALNVKTVLFNSYSDVNNRFTLQWQTDNTLLLFNAAGSQVNPSARLDTSALYRDVSAWYHVVLAVDTTQATASSRLKIYINNVQITAFSVTTYPSQNADLYINTTATHYLGNEPYSGVNETANYYLTEIHFVDGQALTPSDFGRNNPTTGVWEPLPYIGTYGTNGFYLPFSDNSGTTSTTLGADSSGNGNNWTPNNFSVAAGAGNDSLVDTPTPYGTDTGAGGEVRGNYATLNPLNQSGGTLSNGNLTYAMVNNKVSGNFAMVSGKWYSEITIATDTGAVTKIYAIGVVRASDYQASIFSSGVGYYGTDGNKYVDGTASAYGATFTANDVIGIALDADAGTVTFYKNNSSQGAITLPSSSSGWVVHIQSGSGNTIASFNCNFGQRPFAYTAPSGFKALCTQNLPEPTIADGSDYFNTIIYTGNNSSAGATRNLTGVGFQPDFVWLKNRGNPYSHQLFDAIRGTGNKNLRSDSTSGEGVDGNLYGYLSSFDSDGFQVTNGSHASVAGIWVNQSSQPFVAWNWNAGGSNTTNTDGTITSTVRANPTAGFSIVSYTGTGSEATIGHGLGVAPNLIILKRRNAISSSLGWIVFSYLNGVLKYGRLDDTNALLSAGEDDPTSSVFSVLTNADINANNGTYIAYCFAEVEGYSKFGSYTGNGSADGPFVYCGFRPRFIMTKRTDSTSDWGLYDTERDTYNAWNKFLVANTSGAEGTATFGDILSNGFKWRYTGAMNTSGGTYIFAAFAEVPFRYSLAR